MTATSHSKVNRVAAYIGSAVVSLILIAYIVYHIVLSASTPVSTVKAEMATMEQKINLQGYVMRDETVLYAPENLNVNYLVTNGDHVAKESTIAAAYRGEDVQKEIASIDARLSILQKSNSGDSQVLADTASVDSKINALLLNMQRKNSDGKIDYIIQQKNNLHVLLNRRQVITNQQNGYETQIKALQDKKTSLLDADAEQVQYVKTDLAGYFYTEVDGYESAFNSTEAVNMTLDSFEELLRSEPDSLRTESGTAIGKIVTDFTWYLACPIDAKSATSLSTGQKYSIIFPYSNGETIPMTLYRIVTSPESDEAILVFSTNYVLSDANAIRVQSVELVVGSYTGYRVPVSAVRMVDNRKGVYILYGSVVKYRTVSALYESDGYLIAECRDLSDESQNDRLNLYDQIIVKGRDLYDGKIIY